MNVKNTVKLLWTAVKGTFGAALSFAGLLIGLPGLLLQMIGELFIGAGCQLAPKTVHEDTGEKIINEITTE